MDITQQQEQFSNVYLQAVATVAGYSLSKPQVDDDSVDYSIHKRGGNGTIRSPRIDLQLKCQLNDSQLDGQGLSYALKIKNYEDLRPDNVLVPRILLVVLVPRLPSDWLEQYDTGTILKYSGYWASLRGKPPTSNSKTVSIWIPRHNHFTVQQLNQLMSIVESGGAP
jgi:hypothetical protein